MSKVSSVPNDSTTDRPVEVRTAARSIRARVRKPLLVGAAATLCLVTLGGGTVSAMDKTVSIVVDGRTQSVTTLAGSVGGALAAAGISPGSHDTLVPAATAAVSDGSTIVLDRGLLLTVTVDGQERQIWTTVRSADPGAPVLDRSVNSELALSANRYRAIPVGPAVAAQALHTVGISLAGRPVTSTTTSATTVGGLLAQYRIVLGARDTVTPHRGARLSNGLTVRVNRVAVRTSSIRVGLRAPAARTVKDSSMTKGTSKVVHARQNGAEIVTYRVTTTNGRRTATTVIGRRVLIAPVAKLTHVGTKTGFTYVGNEVFTNDTSFGVNWDGLAMCESTHNPRAINANPSAGLPTYGLFQFDLPTWASVGGSGNPMDATPEEQLMRAKLLFQSRGLEPWACRNAAH